MLAVLLASSIGVISVQHKVRALESQYYQALRQSLEANEEWGRLRLEKEHLTSPARVEQIAKTQLNMTSDKSNYQLIYIAEPSANE